MSWCRYPASTRGQGQYSTGHGHPRKASEFVTNSCTSHAVSPSNGRQRYSANMIVERFLVTVTAHHTAVPVLRTWCNRSSSQSASSSSSMSTATHAPHYAKLWVACTSVEVHLKQAMLPRVYEGCSTIPAAASACPPHKEGWCRAPHTRLSLSDAPLHSPPPPYWSIAHLWVSVQP